jgi:hypothetical protein
MKRIIHPATLTSPSDVKTLSNLGSCPVSKLSLINSAKEKLFKDVKLNCKSQALTTVDIGPGGVGVGHKEFTEDGKQAYAQALAYLITKEEVYACNCMNILNDWATKCTVFKGANAPLEAAWGTASMSRACELVKYTVPNWAKYKAMEDCYVNWVRKMLMPHLLGLTEKYKLKWGFYNNWHTSIIEARLQFALLTDDLESANVCIEEYKKILASYVKDDGFTGETLRDSDHCCFGLAGLVQICELAFHQGVDLYSLRNNVLHKCIEFHAELYGTKKVPKDLASKFNISQFKICNWVQPSAWEIARKHYCGRKSYTMRNTDALLQGIRPAGYALHWGYCTLTHACTTP